MSAIEATKSWSCACSSLWRGMRRLAPGAALLVGAALLPGFAAQPAAAAPVVITAPFSASPGDFISLQGSGFSATPRVFIKPAASQQIEIPIAQGRDDLIVLRIPKTMALDAYSVKIVDAAGSWSAETLVNVPVIHNFDAPDIASGQQNMINGRNMALSSGTPTVTLLDVETNAQIPAAVTLTRPTFLWFTPGEGIIAGHTYKAIVSNGFGAATGEATTLGHAKGNDYFGVGRAWGYDFLTKDAPGYLNGAPGGNPADHHFINVVTDKALKNRAAGDGVTHDGPAIQEAIDLLYKNGGGVVYLPPGVYHIAKGGVGLRTGVALRGQSRTNTQILWGATDQYPDSTSGIYLTSGATKTGVADLSIKNRDLTSRKAGNLSMAPTSKFFILRVDWDLGSGWGINLKGDRIVVQNSTFTQAINHQNGDQFTGGVGPLIIDSVSNFVFAYNTVKWATAGPGMSGLSNARVEGNHFTRSASDTIVATAAQLSWPSAGKPIAVGDVISRHIGRQLSIQWGKNVLLFNNIFDVSDGEIKTNWNDGETILNEAQRRNDQGVVTSANATSVSADSKCSGECAWVYFADSVVFIVSGKGAGQWRHVVQKNGNTFTVDKPWDIVPQPGDHFSLAVPSFENTVIVSNSLTGNPTGIGLWAGMFLNTMIASNRLTNNSGIYVNPKAWDTYFAYSGPTFSAYKNIEIKANYVENNNGRYPAYIVASTTLIRPDYIWGTALYGLEVRNNKIIAKPGTAPFLFPEGYQDMVYYQNPAPFVDSGSFASMGAVFQSNACVNCPIVYRISTGVLGTVIWNTSVTASAGVSSTLVTDYKINNAALQKSVGTIIGKD